MVKQEGGGGDGDINRFIALLSYLKNYFQAFVYINLDLSGKKLFLLVIKVCVLPPHLLPE